MFDVEIPSSSACNGQGVTIVTNGEQGLRLVNEITPPLRLNTAGRPNAASTNRICADGCGLMVEANDSRQFPTLGCLLPDVNELINAAVVGSLGEIAKPVLSRLYGPMLGDRVNLH